MADLLLEVGTEELPPGEVGPASGQLADLVRAALDELRLGAGSVRAFATPRRLAVLVSGVAERQRPVERRVRGPAASAAYDADGRPTPAALGFARGQGVPVESLQVVEEAGGRRYVVAVFEDPGRPAREVLPEALARAVLQISFSKMMRWGAGETRFARPIRRLVALLGSQVLPLEVAGVRAGRLSPGHRTLAPRPVTIRQPARYSALLRAARVIVEPDVRRARVVSQVLRLGRQLRGVVVLDPALADELTMSVEHPHALRGRFDARYLTLPRDVLVTVMQHHQQYFAVDDASGRLLPAFIAVRDGGGAHLATVRQGHEWVLTARLADARFFFEEDRKHRLEEYVPRLDELTFHARLGTYGEKTRRLLVLSQTLAGALHLDAVTRQALERAAWLCKADLVTHLVGEFPELQGTVGQIYAGLDEEPAEVARAIGEHYRSGGAGDGSPRSHLGALLGLLDKADTLVGALAAGLMPTGSQDPFGLRRAAQGIIETVLVLRLDLDLPALVEQIHAQYATQNLAGGPAAVSSTVVRDVVEFLRQRLRASLIERGIRYDAADAALAVSGDDLLAAAARAEALAGSVGGPEFARLYVGFDRASRIVTGEAAGAVDPALFEDEAERQLYSAITAVRDPVRRAAAAGDFRAAMERLRPLVGPVNRIFDAVLIMAPDARVRANRLALLRDAAETFRVVADFSKIVMTDEDKKAALGARG